MSQVGSMSLNNNVYFKTKPQEIKSANKKMSTGTKIGIGLGGTAIAASSIYFVMRGRAQNIDKAFENIQKASTIMQELQKSKLSPKNFKQLLFKITNDNELSEKFVTEMIANPRKSKENVRILNKKIGGDKELTEWMLQPKGYQEAYYRHTKKAYREANHPDDLIKTSPNWNIWKLKDKFGSDFTIGEPPKEFGGVDNYRNIFKEALQPHNCTAKNINGIEFGDYITGGLSGKGVRKFETGGKKYILKFQGADNTHSNPDLKDVASMHSDSTFLNAQLDRYLQLNDYHQGSKLKFFDYKTNSAIYEMSEGTKLSTDRAYNMLELNKELNDLNDLGVYYNDLNQSNFLEQNGKISFFDSGESSFVDFFKPGVSGHHFTLPNQNGRSLTDTAAAIQLSK